LYANYRFTTFKHTYTGTSKTSKMYRLVFNQSELHVNAYALNWGRYCWPNNFTWLR